MSEIAVADPVAPRLATACRMLAEARDAGDAKKVADLANAARVYAVRQKLGREAVAAATAVMVDAMTLMGEFLKAAEKNTGAKGSKVTGSKREPVKDDTPTLAECGISKKESMHAQRLVDVREQMPEVYRRVRVGELPVSKAVAALRRFANSGDPESEVAEIGTVGDLNKLVADGRRYGTIYADPPWSYDNQGTRAATGNHYGTMTVDEIAALPVGDLAAPQSHLWLWTTNAFLFECPRLFAAWGFEFKSSYVWVKPQMGIGNYLRNSHEFLLLAVRGGLVGAARDVMSWGEFPRTAHSAKPEDVRTGVVERVSPGPRLELFGRSVVEGWHVWGNQVSRYNLFTHDAPEVR